MATKLSKKVEREFTVPDWEAKKIIVALEPPHMITFREKGRKTQYTLNLLDLMLQAAGRKVALEYEDQHKGKSLASVAKSKKKQKVKKQIKGRVRRGLLLR